MYSFLQQQFQGPFQQMDDMKEQLATIQADSECQALSVVPPGLPLRRHALEQASLLDEPGFLLQQYLNSSMPHMRSVSHPSTPSMQISSLAPSSTSGTPTFITASEGRSMSDIDDCCVVSSFQIFIRGLPGLGSIVLQVEADDTISQVKSKIWMKVNFYAHYSLSSQSKVLDDDSILTQCQITSLSTLTAVHILFRCRPRMVVRNLTGIKLDLFEHNMFLNTHPVTVEELKQEIAWQYGIPVCQQILFHEERLLQDATPLRLIVGTVHLGLRLHALGEAGEFEQGPPTFSGLYVQAKMKSSELRCRARNRSRRTSNSPRSWDGSIFGMPVADSPWTMRSNPILSH